MNLRPAFVIQKITDPTELHDPPGHDLKAQWQPHRKVPGAWLLTAHLGVLVPVILSFKEYSFFLFIRAIKIINKSNKQNIIIVKLRKY